MTCPHYLQTGQRICHADDGIKLACDISGQDASFAVGVPWRVPRFKLYDNDESLRLNVWFHRQPFKIVLD